MSTLTINFTPSDPTPVDGYIIKYRQVGTINYTTLSPNPTGSPAIITGLSGTAYEGIIMTECNSDLDSSGIPFTAGSSINCGIVYKYDASQPIFPSETIVNVGTFVGNIVFNFSAYPYPQKFIIIFDGTEVGNTGYRGDTLYQSGLDSALASKGLPSETIAGTGNGSISFNKTSSTATVLVRVYDPMDGEDWQFTLGCPS